MRQGPEVTRKEGDAGMGRYRAPQSVQSVPQAQLEYAESAPPSEQKEFAVSWASHVLRHTCSLSGEEGSCGGSGGGLEGNNGNCGSDGDGDG